MVNQTKPAEDLPSIIQGGMGVAVSDWRLANAVASHGQLGVVAGTALESVLARRVTRGDDVDYGAADVIEYLTRPVG